MRYLGIDIGGTAVKYGIVTEQGEILSAAEYSVNFDQYETPILDTIVKTSQEFLDSIGVEAVELKGIGVSATGQIDSILGIVDGVGNSIKNWKGAKIKEELSNQFHLPVEVVNDGNCAALGEKWLGNARGHKNVIAITIGTGVGGGIIVNDQILLGNQGFAGEIGHFSIDYKGVNCACGNRGCYERYASMTALINMVQEVLPLIYDSEFTKEDINGKLIFDLCKRGEPRILKVLDEWIEYVVDGLVSLVHIFNPDCIVIGGGVSVQQELFIDKVRSKLSNRVMSNFKKSLIVERAALGNHAGLVGAIYYFIQQNEKDSKEESHEVS
nr:ROK family protein [uncultured Anaerosporobacter sp.]